MSTREGGICIVSCLLNRDGGLERSGVLTGGYVECQSASEIGTWCGSAGGNVVDHARGDCDRKALACDEGRDAGGDSRSRGGSMGDGARYMGEVGLLDGRESLAYAVLTGTGRDLLFSLLIDDDEDRGDWL